MHRRRRLPKHNPALLLKPRYNLPGLLEQEAFMRKLRWMLLGLVLLTLVLAACDGDDDKGDADDEAPTSTLNSPDIDSLDAPNPAGGDFNPGTSFDLGSSDAEVLAGNEGLPGCTDPDDEACPMPLELDLDTTAVSGGMQIQYASRYFDATTDDDAGRISITPSENNRFAERAEFEVFQAESVEAALAVLDAPDVVDWETSTLSGQIGVMRDETVDPPVATTIGAFEAENGEVFVFKLVSNGKYGWDLYSVLYADMVETLTIAE